MRAKSKRSSVVISTFVGQFPINVLLHTQDFRIVMSSNGKASSPGKDASEREECFLKAVRAGSKNMVTRIGQSSETDALEQLCSENNPEIFNPRMLLMRFKDAYLDILTRHALTDKRFLTQSARTIEGPDKRLHKIYTALNGATLSESIANLPLNVQYACNEALQPMSNSTEETKIQATNELLALFTNMRKDQLHNSNCMLGIRCYTFTH